MGLASRDYMQPPHENPDPPPGPRWGVLLVGLIIIAAFLFSMF